MTLREEFEPLLISPRGCHLNAELCKSSWGDAPISDEQLLQQIERAEIWLDGCRRTKQINGNVGSSYGLKHRVESWWRNQKGDLGDVYVSNGCFLMAAHRMRFKIKPIPSRYCAGAGFILDCYNAHLNISSRSLSLKEVRSRRICS